jgi:hypothetical protein
LNDREHFGGIAMAQLDQPSLVRQGGRREEKRSEE